MRVLKEAGRVLVVSIAGALLVVAGIVMLVTPGPGLLSIAAGLAILSRRFRWARRLLDRGQATIHARLDQRGRRRVSRLSGPPADAPSTPATAADRDVA